LQAAAVVILPSGAERKAEGHGLRAQRTRAHAGVFADCERRGVSRVDRRTAIVGVDVNVLAGVVRARIVVRIAQLLLLLLLLIVRRAGIVVAVVAVIPIVAVIAIVAVVAVIVAVVVGVGRIGV